MSRSERRHQEERVKAKWRGVERQLYGNGTQMTWRLVWKEGRRQRIRVLNPSAAEEREDLIEYRAVRRAHHNKCSCEFCKRPRYNRRRDGTRAEKGGRT